MFSNLTNVSSNSLINTINTFWESTSSIFWTNSSFIYQGYWVALTDYLTMPQASLAYANVQLPINLLFFCQLFVNSLFIFTLVSVFLVYLSNQGIQLLSFNLNGGDLFLYSYVFLAEVGDEVGAIDDVIIYGLMFAVIISWYFFFTIFVTYLNSNMTWFIILLNFVFLTAILLPFFVLYSFGASFPVFVRGVGKSTSIFMEAFLDFIAIGVMFSRFIIQNFRLALVFAAFFELSEYIYMNCDFVGLSLFDKFLSLNINHTAGVIYWYDWVSDFLTAQLLLIYYWGHLVIVFITQLINYFLLSFYLFYFLYTTFVFESHEKYFFFKRVF